MAIPWKLPLLPVIPNHLFNKLPLYGPLDIRNYNQYLCDRKKLFNDSYHEKFPYVVSIEEFELLNFIAKGAFGKILLAKRKNKDKRLYAAKVISKASTIKNNCVKVVLNEKRVLQSLDCPFCVRLEYFCQTSMHLYFFLPFISGGDVFTHLRKVGRFKENLSRFYAAQIVLVLELLHHCNIVYRDLKPENLLIDHLGFLKLTDFGFAKEVRTRTYTFCGTTEYIAPEIIVGKGHGKSVDWWSFGVLIFELNAGVVPFLSTVEIETFKKILKVEYTMPKYFSSELKDLVNRLLQRDISKRAGGLRRGVEEIKSHQWFKGIDWLDLLNRKVIAPFIPGNTSNISKTNFPNVTTVPKISFTGLQDLDEYFKDF